MYPKPDILGRQMVSSRLTVTGIFGKDTAGKTLYSTHCSCNGRYADRIVGKAWHLLRARPSSCGKCRDKYSLIGVERGEMTVVDITDRTYRGSPIYEMRCRCGRIKHWRSCQLTRTQYPTCGHHDCKAKSPSAWALPEGQAAFNRLQRRYKTDAKLKGIVYELTDEQFKALIEGPCAYCGIPPMRTTKGISNGSIKYNGVDRLRNNGGYVPTNTVSCCTPCNLMKGSLDRDVFVKLVRLIAHKNRLLFPANAEELRSYAAMTEHTTPSRRVPPVDLRWLRIHAG
jgi:hypothetical protein